MSLARIDFDQYPIVIMSCDSYSDIWQPLLESFDKFWPDCPFPIYLCSELKEFDHPRIRNLRTERELGWAAMTIEILRRLQTPNVIYLQEDYILKGQVSNDKVVRYLEFFQNRNAAYLRLVPLPNPDQLVDAELNVGIIYAGSHYRTSLQAAIWDRQVLLDLLRPEESGWDFERESIRRSEDIDRDFLSVAVNSDHPNINHHKYPIDYYSTAILQGKWQKEGVKILRRAGLDIDTKDRGVLTRWDFFYYHQRKKGDGIRLRVLTWLDRVLFNRRKNKRLY